MATYPPRHSLSSNEIHDFGTAENTIVMAPEGDFSHLPSWPSHITLPPFLLRKVVSEIISTYLLVFVSCGVGAIHLSDDTRISQLGASIASGLIVTVMIYSVGHISGAHMNPAVTLAFAVSKHGQFPWIQVPFYWLAQLSGAIISSFVLKALLHPIKNIGTTTPSGTPLQAFIMEIVVTFIMMFVTSAVATDTRAVGELAGLAVGSSVCINSILAGPVSGGSMNPARSLGPALASKRFNSLWVYFLGPVLGTLTGSLSYNFIRFDKSRKCEPPKMSSFKLRRLQSQEETAPDAADIP